MRKDLQNGRSMIEMLGVLSIIGILTVGGFSLISKTVTENKINKVIDEIGDLSRRTRVIFRDYIYDESPSNDTNMSEYIYNAKSYPDVLEWDSSDNVFVDDEDLEMSVYYTVKNEVEYFIVKVDNMTEEICMAVANGQWGTAATNGFSGISFSDSTAIGGSIDLGTAANTCADDTTIYLSFR